MPAHSRTPRKTARLEPAGSGQDYLETTRTFWQPHVERPLTREDAREMAQNLLGFFAVLREWRLAEQGQVENGAPPADPPTPRRRRTRRKAPPTD